MACVIKLKENIYIEWSKASDSPASKTMTLAELKEHLVEVLRVENMIKAKPLAKEDLNNKYNNLLSIIETTGTSDLTGAVDLDFILKYNRAGKNETQLSLEEIINNFK